VAIENVFYFTAHGKTATIEVSATFLTTASDSAIWFPVRVEKKKLSYRLETWRQKCISL